MAQEPQGSAALQDTKIIRSALPRQSSDATVFPRARETGLYMLNFNAVGRTSRVIIVIIALVAAYAASQLVGPSLVLRIVVSVLTVVAVSMIGIRLASKRS